MAGKAERKKISTAYIFVVVQCIVTGRQALSSQAAWPLVAAGILMFIGLLLQNRGSAAYKVLWIAAALLDLLAYATQMFFWRWLAGMGIGGRFLWHYFDLSLHEAPMMTIPFFTGALLALALMAVLFCVRVAAGKGEAWKIFALVLKIVFYLSLVMEFICAMASKGYFLAMDIVAIELIVFLTISSLCNTLRLQKAPKTIDPVVAAAWILVLGLCFGMLTSGAFTQGGGNDGQRTCKSCGRSFEAGTTDSRSIIKTGMCGNCYNNFDSNKWVLDE